MIATQLFTGLVLGMILVLLALGLSLIFGLMTVVNFAHGAFYMLGAYIGFFILGLTGNFWLGLLIVPLVIGTLGLMVERTLVKPLYGPNTRSTNSRSLALESPRPLFFRSPSRRFSSTVRFGKMQRSSGTKEMPRRAMRWVSRPLGVSPRKEISPA